MDDILLTRETIREMANSLDEAEATFEDAIEWACREQVQRVVDVMLRDGFPSDLGFEIPHETWAALWRAGEVK